MRVSNIIICAFVPAFSAASPFGWATKNNTGSLNVTLDQEWVRSDGYFMNCGHGKDGKGGSNGHGVWVPIDTFQNMVNTFCKAILQVNESGILTYE